MSIFDNDKIEWFTYVYAPRYYDAYLISGENFWFYHEDKREGLGFWANPGGGWRSTGVMASGGSPSQPVKIPLGVQLTWLSHTEKKYYQARIHLPKEKILNLFKQKYKSDYLPKNGIGKLNTIDIALAPGGFISIRVGGARSIEVAQFQASEIEVTWDFFAATHHFNAAKLPESEFMDDQYKKLPDYIKKQVDEDTIPLTRWKEYSENCYLWYFATKMELAGCRIGYVNGESRFYDKADLKKIEKEIQAVPAWFMFFYIENGKRYVANVRFTEQKLGAGEKPDDDVAIFEIFKKYFSSQPLPTALIIERDGSGFVALLTNGTKQQKLDILHTEIWEAKSNQYSWF